jgi:aminopeptidase-like protein
MRSPSAKASTAAELEAWFDRLWPIMRSITGDGVRATHDILSELVPLERIEIPSGTSVFDWTVPQEWVFREAYVIDPNGNRILDAAENTLHLVNYSVPFRGRLSRAELDEHLFSLPDMPDAIPYVTSYYRKRWGFCLSQRRRDVLPDGDYQVVVDTDHIDGSLTLSEAVLPGRSDAEVLISTYTCHPSMANNELSGPLATAFLAKRIADWSDRRLTYRFVFAPETIGAITYLSQRGEHLRTKMVAGYVVTCVAIDTEFTFQQSQRRDTLADRAGLYALSTAGVDHRARDFRPTGSDERQYCSPGFDLPMASLMRGPYGEYSEYHTSLDNKDRIDFGALAGTVNMLEAICRTLDRTAVYRNTAPFGEPNLGKRDLYPTIGGKRANMGHRRRAHATLWLCNQCDGTRDLIEIAERSGMPLELLHDIATDCVEKGLFEEMPAETVR